MTRPLAVVDTSTLILLITQKADDSREEQETERRRVLVKDSIRAMGSKYRWALPCVVVAELGRDGSADAVVQQLSPQFGGFRTLAFNHRAACLAARISAKALKARPPGAERGAVKYDALICATAIAYGAECIVTENRRDFDKYVAEIGATLDIIMPSTIPAGGQLHLLHRPKP